MWQWMILAQCGGSRHLKESGLNSRVLHKKTQVNVVYSLFLQIKSVFITRNKVTISIFALYSSWFFFWFFFWKKKECVRLHIMKVCVYICINHHLVVRLIQAFLFFLLRWKVIASSFVKSVLYMGSRQFWKYKCTLR